MTLTGWPYDEDDDGARQQLDDEQAIAEAKDWEALNDKMRQLVAIRRENVELIETLSRSVTLLNNSIDEAIALCNRIDAFMAEVHVLSIKANTRNGENT